MKAEVWGERLHLVPTTRVSLIEIRAMKNRNTCSWEWWCWAVPTGLLVQPVLTADNLWSTYSDKGAFVEKKGVSSVPVSEESRPGGLPYVLTDIMTYFTMLVGIYFPSVTGEAPASPPPPPTSASVCFPVCSPTTIFL